MECEEKTMDYKENRKTEGRRRDNNVEDEEREEKETEGEEEGDKLVDDSKDEASEESDNKDESSDSGDVEYLQLAWENLEVARTICDKWVFYLILSIFVWFDKHLEKNNGVELCIICEGKN